MSNTIAPVESEPIARCRIIAMENSEAECTVLLDGFELPRVSFPARTLRQKGLAVGDRFIWHIRSGSDICLDDIDAGVRQSDTTSANERAELERLYSQLLQGLKEDGGNWPVFTGPGD